MGWANCGKDSKGRPIGYAHAATCDHAGCKTKIDRGLSYACGEMHGDTEVGCEGYFCSEHRAAYIRSDGDEICICDQCAATALADPMWSMDDEEGVIVPAAYCPCCLHCNPLPEPTDPMPRWTQPKLPREAARLDGMKIKRKRW